jgi:hypothetical protein
MRQKVHELIKIGSWSEKTVAFSEACQDPGFGYVFVSKAEAQISCVPKGGKLEEAGVFPYATLLAVNGRSVFDEECIPDITTVLPDLLKQRPLTLAFLNRTGSGLHMRNWMRPPLLKLFDAENRSVSTIDMDFGAMLTKTDRHHMFPSPLALNSKSSKRYTQPFALAYTTDNQSCCYNFNTGVKPWFHTLSVPLDSKLRDGADADADDADDADADNDADELTTFLLPHYPKKAAGCARHTLDFSAATEDDPVQNERATVWTKNMMPHYTNGPQTIAPKDAVMTLSVGCKNHLPRAVDRVRQSAAKADVDPALLSASGKKLIKGPFGIRQHISVDVPKGASQSTRMQLLQMAVVATEVRTADFNF